MVVELSSREERGWGGFGGGKREGSEGAGISRGEGGASG